MYEITPDDCSAVNAGYWAVLNKIKIPTEFSFKDHEYQIEPISDKCRRKCYMKSAQTFGATTLETLDDLWGMIQGWYENGVAHIFPTADEVGDFSKSKFKPLISNNMYSIGKYVKDTNTDNLKKVRDAFLYFRGARLSQKVGDTDEDSSSKTAGFSVDKVVFDEVDFMDMAVVEKYKGRMGHSKLKREVYLGNPSHEDFGIDKIFKASDQRYWFRRCDSCNTWTCAEKSFPNCVKIRDDGTGYIGCDKCGRELLIWAGKGSSEWVAEFPSKSDYMHGYLLSQLSTVYNDPAEILSDYTNPPNGNLADVYRLRLSKAYSSKDDKLTRSMVLQCCGNEMMAASNASNCAMGVDVGKIKHVVIGIKTAKDRFEILKVAKVQTFNEIYDLAKRYGVKSDVVDIRPYEDEARAYQKSSGHKTFLCEYSDSMLQDSTYNEDTGIVKAHRTGIFDTTHKLFTEGRIKLPRQCPEIEEFARQCCNTAKFEEKDKRKGTIVFRYRPTGDEQEHYRNALNYFILAAQGFRLPITNDARKKARVENCQFEYSRLG